MIKHWVEVVLVKADNCGHLFFVNIMHFVFYVNITIHP
jgi:hypothetical protein